jgi:hypothetical protein
MNGLDAWSKHQADTGFHAATRMMFPAYGGGSGHGRLVTRKAARWAAFRECSIEIRRVRG